jgi:purine-binding chemotaxis protein CheW
MDISKLRKKAKEQQAAAHQQAEDKGRSVPVPATPVPEPKPPAVKQEIKLQDNGRSASSAESRPAAEEKPLLELANDELKRYAPDGKDRELLCFRLGGEEYAIDLSTVKEIIRVKEITPVPNTSDFVLGITVLRGEIIPVIDLRKRIGLPFLKFTAATRLIMITFEGTMTGLVVDGIPSVKRVAVESIQSADTVGSVDIRFLAGISTGKGGFTVLLKLEEILKQTDMLKAE